jgi:two-component system CheB/CheR fusion protein
MAAKLTMAEQAERRRISRILHDDLQQLLHAIGIKVHLVKKDLLTKENQELVTALEEVLAWIDQATTTTRRLTVDLSPQILHNEGLVNALEWLKIQMQEMHQLDVTLEAEHAFFIADQDLRVLLFQIVRELLFNVEKHAGTHRATVDLKEVDHHLVIHVIDDGVGFDVKELASREDQEGGFGLTSVRERLDLVGGYLVVRSQPGEGTHIEVHAPEWRTSREVEALMSAP